MGIDHYYCMGRDSGGGGAKWAEAVPSLPFHCSVAFLPWTEIIVGTKDQEENSGEGEGDYRRKKGKCEEGQT